MAGSVFGNIFKITSWGESHGRGLGVCIDGVPAGLKIEENDIRAMLDRRKPGQSAFTTQRKEEDKIQILSGIKDGICLGTPIAILVENTDQKSKDYSKIENIYRPGHADWSFDAKYGIKDHRGGGRSSGRETVARVIAGAFAKKILNELGISICAYTLSIGPVSLDRSALEDEIKKARSAGKIEKKIRDLSNNSLYMPDETAYNQAKEYLEKLIKEKDSAGGRVECLIEGLKPGIGQPVFDKLDATLAKAIFSIGAVKGFEIGEGFNAALMKGSKNNDSFIVNEQGRVGKKTNHAGGILGGMSDGDSICFRAAFKPTPSVAIGQKSINKERKPVDITIEGRHDPVIVPRAVVVVESMAAVALVDLIMQDMGSRMKYLKDYYDNKDY